jgi:hypothetical protein
MKNVISEKNPVMKFDLEKFYFIINNKLQRQQLSLLTKVLWGLFPAIEILQQ